MTKPICLLFIEDEEADYLVIRDHLRWQGLNAHTFRVKSEEELSAALHAGWDAVLSDFHVFGLDFHRSLALIRERQPDLPVILVAGSVGEEKAVDLLKEGVADFVLKNNLSRLAPAIQRAIREVAERRERLRAETALRASQVQLQAIFDNLREGIITVSAMGQVLDWNRAAGEMHGCGNLEECYAVSPLPGHPYEFSTLAGEALPPEHWPVPRILRGETLRDLELGLACPRQGWKRILSYNGNLVRDAHGTPLLGLLSLRDITERKAEEEERAWAAMLFHNIQEGAVVTDRQGHILWVNPAFSAITGYGEGEILGHNMRQVQSGHHDLGFYQQMWEAINATGGWQGEIWDRRKSGETFLERLTINAVQDKQGEVTHYVGTFTDITQLKLAHQMEYLAHHDPLTGLPNRLRLLSRLEHALEITRRHRSLGAVLSLDLDGFKAVNDTWGHPAGDEVLQQVAKRLASRLREMDTLARMGGDEFMVILEDIDGPESAETVAREVIEILGQPFFLAGDHEAHVGTSVGIALFPVDGNDIETMLRHSDAALYRAKGEGKDTYRFHAG